MRLIAVTLLCVYAAHVFNSHLLSQLVFIIK